MNWNATAPGRVSTFGSRRMPRSWNVASVPHAMLPLLRNWYGESRNSSSKNNGHRDKYRALLKKEGVSVSHQCIYNLIHADASGELARHTRHKLKYRCRSKYKRFPIAERTSIHSRSEQADGIRFGDFEMDLIVDSHNHAILAIVERSTNMLFMTKLAHGKKSEPLAKAVRRLLLPYKKHIHNHWQRPWICRTQAHYKVFGSSRLFRRSLCLMAKGSDWKYKQTHQTIYPSTPTSTSYR